MPWFEKLRFESVIKDIVSDARRGQDIFVDPFRFEDLGRKDVRDELIAEIKTRISSTYPVSDLIKIDVPKSNYVLRPGARPTLIDLISYEAVTDYIGSFIYKKIPALSFSFKRFKEKYEGKVKYASSVNHWIEFENLGRIYSENPKFKFMLVTDITSFFEHISIEVLDDRLKRFSTDQNFIHAVNFLTQTLLNNWTATNKIPRFGLPQGPDASRALADIYLYSLDREMQKKKVTYFRFMDDIRIFSKNKNEIKINIGTLVLALRDLKLNLNAKKTIIYETQNKESLGKVFDPEAIRLQFLSEAFRSNKSDVLQIVKPPLFELKNMFYDPKDAFNERHLKFFIFRTVDLMKWKLLTEKEIHDLVSEFLNLFDEQHHLANILCWFLVAAGCYSESQKIRIQENLIKFICDKKKNIYKWQEMWALDAIRQLGPITKTNLLKIKKTYSNKHELCYSQFCLIASQSNDSDEREEILEAKRIQSDEYRATLGAVYSLNPDVLKRAGLRVPEYFRIFCSRVKPDYFGYKYILPKPSSVEEPDPSPY